MRVLGPAPDVHEHAARSFVYEIDLAAESVAAHLAGTAEVGAFVSIDVGDEGRLRELSRRAYDGARIEVVPEGLSPDGRTVRLCLESPRDE
jgi:SAM-dependent MidA family methyltransferase